MNTAQNNFTNKNRGFTLIELLIVVMLIGVLSGILVSLLNSDQLRARTEDTTRKANLEKLVMAIESYRYAEQRLPAHNTSTFVPEAPGLSTYLQAWPPASDGPRYYYRSMQVGGVVTNYCIYVSSAVNPSRHFKYHSGDSSPKTKDCNGTAGDATLCTCST
jgi:prepilin-type N-terminal cleavage/methylation domain-containing protein